MVAERKISSASLNKKSKDFNLENVLRRCSADDVSHESVLQLKNVPRGVYYIIIVALMTWAPTLMLIYFCQNR